MRSPIYNRKETQIEWGFGGGGVLLIQRKGETWREGDRKERKKGEAEGAQGEGDGRRRWRLR